jgi:hypothetical protein
MSPEREFCEFLSAFTRLIAPSKVIETGVGQGFTTRRLVAALEGVGRLLCFEADAELRASLGALPFFRSSNVVLSNANTPSGDEFADAVLTVLDSDPGERLAEIARWYVSAPDGAVLVVHDTGNGHDHQTIHASIASAISALSLPGWFLRNPRGAFVGYRPNRAVAEALSDATARAESAEQALRALQATRSYRWTKPLRRVRGVFR